MRTTFFSFACRVFCQLSVIILPYFLFEKNVYGIYIYIYSLSQLLAYFLDFGFSLYVLRIQPEGRFFKRVERRLNVRDLIYVIIAILGASIYLPYAPYVIGGVIGAIWVGRLPKARVTQGIRVEGISLCLNAIGILIALAICFLLNVSDSAVIFFGCVVVPRIIALVTVLTFTLLNFRPRLQCSWIDIRYRPRSIIKDMRWLYPYAVQGVFTAATMNLDALILTGLGASALIIADVKMIMTLIGGLSMPVDVAGQYKISRTPGGEEKKTDYDKLVRHEKRLTGVAIVFSVFAALAIFKFKNAPLLTILVLPLSVWLRSRTIIKANLLTMKGRSGQSSRILNQVIANFAYWALLGMGTLFGSMQVYLVAILALSVLHYILMRD